MEKIKNQEILKTKKKTKVFCDKCGGKGYWYDYGHEGEMDCYHECDKCYSSGYVLKENKKLKIRRNYEQNNKENSKK